MVDEDVEFVLGDAVGELPTFTVNVSPAGEDAPLPCAVGTTSTEPEACTGVGEGRGMDAISEGLDTGDELDPLFAPTPWSGAATLSSPCVIPPPVTVTVTVAVAVAPSGTPAGD